MSQRPTIGWIGTGVMGASMAARLQKAGYPLEVFSRTRKKARALLEGGATWRSHAAELTKNCETIITMVGYPTEVEAIYFGDPGGGGWLAKAHPDSSLSTLIDMTTSEPSLAARIAAASESMNLIALDAPVSGGDIGARNGTLSIMVGGDRAGFEASLPILQVLGEKIVWQGVAGTGQHTKMVNQILIASNMVGVCEGLLYGERAGLDPECVLESVGGGAAASWSLQNLAPRILKKDFSPGFYVEHFIKDMEIALVEAERMQLSLPGLELARRLYEEVRGMGQGRSGTQALYLALKKLNESSHP